MISFMEESFNQEKKEFFDILLNSIIKIEDTDGNKILYSNLDVKYIKSKRSKVYSWILFIDDIPCTSKKRNYKITYQCRCGSIHTILLRKFLQKTKFRCQHCLQDKNFGGIGSNNPNRQVKQVKERKPKNFQLESNTFKNNYFEKHLTLDEFNKWIYKIYQINDIVITNDIRNKIIYIPYYPCNNQSKYTDVISLDGKIISIKTIYLKCDICGKIHKVHTNNIKNKNIAYVKCQQCALSNTTFPIRKYLDTNLTYQSSVEKQFLDICFEHNINVKNGLKIPYIWNNKIHNYISDFYLQDYNFIIEIKSNNIFYRQQKASGKLDAKNLGAEIYAKNNNMKFVFLFDNMINDFFDTLLNERDSLTNFERN